VSRAFSVPPITNHTRDKLVPYTLEGYTAENRCQWLPVSYNAETQCGSYYFQLLPGAVTVPHVHPGYEEFYLLEGEAVESDGTVIKAGDFISFPPGSYHFTRSDKGCLALVFEWRP
jgi:quercetin dioxygenase-like cupin family protein